MNATVSTHLKELIYIQIIAAVKIHEVEGVIDVRKALLAVLTHHRVQERTALVELLP